MITKIQKYPLIKLYRNKNVIKKIIKIFYKSILWSQFK